MFHAELVSLSDGQSYPNVEVCEDADLDRYDLPRPFEEWTGCMFAQGQCLIVHHWKFKIIHLDRTRRSGPNATHTDRLILDGDIIYAPVTFIHQDNWASMGIPHFFIKRNGIAGQLAFSTPEGTFITHDVNVTSIIVPDPRPRGITQAESPSVTPFTVKKQNSAPDTIHGQVARRK